MEGVLGSWVSLEKLERASTGLNPQRLPTLPSLVEDFFSFAGFVPELPREIFAWVYSVHIPPPVLMCWTFRVQSLGGVWYPGSS